MKSGLVPVESTFRCTQPRPAPFGALVRRSVAELRDRARDERGAPPWFTAVESAIAAIKGGRPVVVIDDEDRENEGDLIFASELATPELVAFVVRYTSGYICVAVTEEDADRLDLPPMF
ncbi:MAG: ribBA, partial [Modestobacter sp.]|nr:ribBA [Modestobacter sp.]